jgi:N-acylglucosamine 2-epimerase/mannose-6-phosphate isomerase
MSDIPYSEIRAWVFNAALPLWSGPGYDPDNGIFREALNLKGEPALAPKLRTRALCRQIYVYAHGALMGWEQGEALSARAAETLHAKAWLGPEKGYARLLSPAGEPLDETPDLYDLAFVMYAYAWRYKVARRAEDLARMYETLDFIESRLKDKDGEGYWHQWPAQGHRVQNPHMHLLEATLAALDTTGDARFRALADDLVALFKRRFFDGVILGECFTRDWRRAAGDPGRLVEPGHQFEWAWILTQYHRLTGTDVTAEAHALVAFSEHYGVDPRSQATYQLIRDDGAVLDAGSRTWPNTERIKGWLALYELAGIDPRPAVAGSVRLLLDRYLGQCAPGVWIDHFDAEGRPIAEIAPASTLYHVFLAFAEVLRLEPKLSA